MSETLLLVAGCIIFATATVATLLYGYMVVNRAWLADDGANAPVPSVLPRVGPVPIPIPVPVPD